MRECVFLSDLDAKKPFQRIGLPLFIAWGLSPAILLAGTGLWLGQSGIPGLDSEDFPGPQLKGILALSFLILYPWSVLLVGELGERALNRVLLAIPLALVVLITNTFLAIGGCAVVSLANEVGSYF